MLLSSCAIAKFAGYYASAGDPEQGDLKGELFSSEYTTYRIGPLPGVWSKVKIEGGDLAFSNSSSGATITVNSTCDPNKTKYSLIALSESLLIGINRKEALSREIIYVDGQEALRSIYTGSYNGIALKIASVVFKKGECVYDFTYVSAPDTFEPGIAEFNNFISAFRVM